MVTLANELQPAKARGPISVTELGMVTLANELQPSKASAPITVLSPGISSTKKSSTSQPEAWKLEHLAGWMLRNARTSVPGMASDTGSWLFNRGLSPTTIPTELMWRFDSSSQGSHPCSSLFKSRTVMPVSNSNALSAPDSCLTVISLAMAASEF